MLEYTEGLEKKITPMLVVVTVYRILQKSVSQDTINAMFKKNKLFQYGTTDFFSKEFFNQLVSLCMSAQNLLKKNNKEGIDLLCSQAMEYIDQHYMDDNLSLSSVSELLHVSPNYLSLNMKKYAGDTFINLLIKKRMTVAADLLCTTKLKVLEIARMCGYTDQHYFSYCFKKYYGMSPVQMRNSKGKGEEKV